MVIINEQYVKNVAEYLDVPLGKITTKNGFLVHIHKNQSTEGVINIILSLLKDSKSNLTPKDISEESLARQWLEYVIIYVGNISTYQTTQFLLKDLDHILSTKTYLVQNRLTIADIALFYSLLDLVASLSSFDKEKYLNISRWFDNIQQDPILRKKNNLVDFSTNYLANLVPAKH